MISTKGRYALRFLVNLSRLGKDGQASLKDIAEEEEISIKYLERIAHDLSKEGIIQGS
ncbi:MAG: RrF2 family transcriptional regulator, partial [Candidatus Ornithospirochaeta sp.]